MAYNDVLIPARFLVLLAHCSITIVILYNQDENIKSCLPLEYTDEDYETKNYELSVGLGVALALIGLEIMGFMSGLSMFMPSISLLSILCHCCASVALSYFVTDKWDCNIYWWIFAFCSLIPALLEIAISARFLLFRKI